MNKDLFAEMESLLPLPATALANPTTMTVDQVLTLVSGKQFIGKLWLVTGMTQFADAMELLLLSFLATEIRCPFHLNSYDITLLQTCVLIGMFIGSNLTGKYSDSFGRRPAVILSLALTVVGGLAATFASTFTIILFARFVVGLGVGSAPVALTLFTEFLPTASVSRKETRGRSLIIFFLFFSVGALFETLVAWATLSTFYRWRALLFASALPSVLLLIITPCWLPESPRWLLIARGDTAAAMKVLHQVASANGCESKLPSGVIRLVVEADDGGLAAEADHYKVLGVANDATEKQVSQAYRMASLRWHPDRSGGSKAAFQRVQEAYETLADDSRRRDYDNGVKEETERENIFASWRHLYCPFGDPFEKKRKHKAAQAAAAAEAAAAAAARQKRKPKAEKQT